MLRAVAESCVMRIDCSFWKMERLRMVPYTSAVFMVVLPVPMVGGRYVVRERRGIVCRCCQSDEPRKGVSEQSMAQRTAVAVTMGCVSGEVGGI